MYIADVIIIIIYISRKLLCVSWYSTLIKNILTHLFTQLYTGCSHVTLSGCWPQ